MAQKSGAKSMSAECIDGIRGLIGDILDDLARAVVIANSEHQTKTIMPGHVYAALRSRGYNVTPSTKLSTSTYAPSKASRPKEVVIAENEQ
jgi:hypothetical protein